MKSWLLRCVSLVGLLSVLWLGLGHDVAQAFTEEQKLLSEVWRIVDRAYVDDTFNQQNWWFVRQRALRQSLNNREETYAAIQEMLASLGDPFTRFLPPDQYRSLQTNTSGELMGVGLQITQEPEAGGLRVIAPIEGSPAAAANIQPNDHILFIDGVATDSLSLEEAADRMRGAAGSRVTLTVLHGDDPPQDIDLVRDRISLNPVYADLRSQPQGLNVGYIRLTQFNANATTEIANAIEQLHHDGANAYLLDLRNNPGGLLQAGIDVARLWMDEGVVVYTVNRNGILDSFSTNHSALTDDPLVVLVNQGTASASEILAGALQDNGRAQLVGEQTFGKGLIQSLFSLSDGSGLAVTIARYETPNHRDINRQGIAPDVQVPLEPITRSQLATAADTQYQAAIDVLSQQVMLADAA
jgi:carboxyl-terminal processing protease